MQSKEVSNVWVVAALGVLAVILIVVGFLVFHEKAPTKDVNMVGRDQLKARPEPQAPPDWVKQKLAGGAK